MCTFLRVDKVKDTEHVWLGLPRCRGLVFRIGVAKQCGEWTRRGQRTEQTTEAASGVADEIDDVGIVLCGL